MKPAAPTAVRAIAGESSSGRYAYFDRWRRLPACTHAYPMRSPSQIDPKQTPGMDAGKVGPTRLPWAYDATEDAARLQIHPAAGFIEPQTRRLTVGTLADRRSFCFIFDFKYDAGWYYHGDGYMKNYKNWYCYVGGQYWIQASHMHLHRGAELDGGGPKETVGLLWLGFPSEKWKDGQPKLVAPQSWRQGEKLMPVTTEYLPKIGKWNRHVFFVEGTHGDGTTNPLMHLSTWYLDEDRGPVTVYNRVPINMIGPMTLWSFSYDTSAEGPRLNGLMQKWIQNVLVLRGLELADVTALLERPIR